MTQPPRPPQSGAQQGPWPGPPPQGPSQGQPQGPSPAQPPGQPWPGGPGAPGFGPGQPAWTGPPAPRTPPLAVLALVAGVVLTALGLSIPFDSTCLWATSTAWAIFAMIAALVSLTPLFGRSGSMTPARAWTIGAVGSGALLLFWVLVALPGVTSNQGFVLTLATAASVGGCWLSPGRRL